MSIPIETMPYYDVIIIGAGAAGLMCAIEAAKRGRHVLVLDHANKAGKKILISGGGRCNFTNIHANSKCYISHNPNFCISALSRYTAQDFIKLVEAYRINYHEKTLGQLFCDNSSKEIVKLLLSECERYQVTLLLNCDVQKIMQDSGFILTSSLGVFKSTSLIIATGGLSFPTMGASPFGYKIAEQFALKVYPPRAGLVPLTLMEKDLNHFKNLSGLSTFVEVSCSGKSFKEALLFTHRGLSGPAILQISSFWQNRPPLHINWFPEIDLYEHLLKQKTERPKAHIKTVLSELLPKRLAETLHEVSLHALVHEKTLTQMANKELQKITELLTDWTIIPNGTEGYRTAEVSLGGIDCNELSSKTLEAKKVPGLYFIGEVVDVTGYLGGYNFQWAWASGWCAGQYV